MSNLVFDCLGDAPVDLVGCCEWCLLCFCFRTLLVFAVLFVFGGLVGSLGYSCLGCFVDYCCSG